MQFTATEIADLILIIPDVHEDDRGFFMETYQSEQFEKAGITAKFLQDNHSGSRQGTLRGIHYQIRQSQGKLVRVVSGEIFDVAVDLRRNSQTFGKWIGTYLSSKNRQQLWIPEGFGHGLYVISEWAELIYKATDYYAPEWERTLIWNDPTVGIEWPILQNCPLILNSKDIKGKNIDEIELFE